MNMQDLKIECFSRAIACLPPRLQKEALAIPNPEKCEELRLRAGQKLSAVLDGEEQTVSGVVVDVEDLRETVSRAARYSVHSYGDALAHGYLPLTGGHRLGVCGTTILKAGEIAGIRTISSLNLRIACQAIGSADDVIDRILEQGCVKNTLILSPPGFGKTTLLRDLIRQLSGKGIRIAVADERSELAAMQDGIAQFDLGPRTDIMDGCPKAQGILILLKTMSPVVVALDEITSPRDVDAIAYAGHCGVSVLATAHAADQNDLKRRPLYQNLMELGVFEQVLVIARHGAQREYTFEIL